MSGQQERGEGKGQVSSISACPASSGDRQRGKGKSRNQQAPHEVCGAFNYYFTLIFSSSRLQPRSEDKQIMRASWK